MVGIVRRPDPVPCAKLRRAGEWDFCRNGQYTERGIKELDGYLLGALPDHTRTSWSRSTPRSGLLGVLLEPTSVVAKAWEQVDRVGGRAHWEPKTVLVTGAGPIGLLAALHRRPARPRGARDRPDDRRASSPIWCAASAPPTTRASVADACPDPDVIIECTGVAVARLRRHDQRRRRRRRLPHRACPRAATSSRSTTGCSTAAWCWRTWPSSDPSTPTGATTRRRPTRWPAADRSWLERLVTRRVPLEQLAGCARNASPTTSRSSSR